MFYAHGALKWIYWMQNYNIMLKKYCGYTNIAVDVGKIDQRDCT